MKKERSFTKGITLISLVITIIVLLILATVAISMAVDSNGLFKRAEYAAKTWNDSVADESTAIENAMLILNKIGSSTAEGDTPPPQEEPTIKVELEVNEAEVAGETIPVTAKATKIDGSGEVTEGITYEFYKSNEPDGASSQIATHTFKNLDETAEYTLKVVATDANGTTVESSVTIGVFEIYVDDNTTPVRLRYTVGTTWEDFVNSEYPKDISDGKELKVVNATYRPSGAINDVTVKTVGLTDGLFGAGYVSVFSAYNGIFNPVGLSDPCGCYGHMTPEEYWWSYDGPSLR